MLDQLVQELAIFAVIEDDVRELVSKCVNRVRQEFNRLYQNQPVEYWPICTILVLRSVECDFERFEGLQLGDSSLISVRKRKAKVHFGRQPNENERSLSAIVEKSGANSEAAKNRLVHRRTEQNSLGETSVITMNLEAELAPETIDVSAEGVDRFLLLTDGATWVVDDYGIWFVNELVLGLIEQGLPETIANARKLESEYNLNVGSFKKVDDATVIDIAILRSRCLQL